MAEKTTSSSLRALYSCGATTASPSPRTGHTAWPCPTATVSSRLQPIHPRDYTPVLRYPRVSGIVKMAAQWRWCASCSYPFLLPSSLSWRVVRYERTPGDRLRAGLSGCAYRSVSAVVGRCCADGIHYHSDDLISRFVSAAANTRPMHKMSDFALATFRVIYFLQCSLMPSDATALPPKETC